ncbi:PREDICTED: uncharacterized protein LOC109341921 [Lupinus angustifolius]|uniref:uncharacterized protein LOC109341921 n=1 Tax=Lupinus angustifolius TaxID=3871 RepID=UPI00092F0330|nr:PREDICTED: uncharacterized protein LOC109341921 [Lupinus angustifolius]
MHDLPCSFYCHLDSTQRIERFTKYDGECSRRLMAKYFSGKIPFWRYATMDRNIYEEQMTVSDELIKSSRLPCFCSYTDLVVGFEEQCINGSIPHPDAEGNMSNGKYTVKKSN